MFTLIVYHSCQIACNEVTLRWWDRLVGLVVRVLRLLMGQKHSAYLAWFYFVIVWSRLNISFSIAATDHYASAF